MCCSDSLAVGSVPEGINIKGQEDELAKILQETAAAMIDVAGSTSHSLDLREHQERTRHYHLKIQSLSPSLLKLPVNSSGDAPNPEKHLNAPLISEEDHQLVSRFSIYNNYELRSFLRYIETNAKFVLGVQMEWALDEVEEALHSIRVANSDDLVVPFGGQQAINVGGNEC